ncbi:MAG: hypothetical protein WDW38_011071 [Sanguina aurantia]
MEGEQVEAPQGNGEEVVVVLGKRCYIGNLAWKTSWQDLKDKFREIGTVVYANVIRDDDGRSKGWGIVEYETPEEALQAISTLNGVDIGGRRVLVREDREDRDVKSAASRGEGGQQQQPREPRERRERVNGGRSAGRGRGRGEASTGRGSGGRGPRPERTGESSGLQIVVQGIPWSYTAHELGALFIDFADVDVAEVATGYDGRSRGFGTVRFHSTEAAASAIEKFHESELEGRTLAVFLDKFM